MRSFTFEARSQNFFCVKYHCSHITNNGFDLHAYSHTYSRIQDQGLIIIHLDYSPNMNIQTAEDLSGFFSLSLIYERFVTNY